MYMDRARKRQSRPDMQFISKYLLKFTVPLFVLLIVLFFTSSFKKSIYFPINEVKVFGAQNTDHEMIQHLITPLVSQGFFDVDVSEIKEQLAQSPWVGRVMVQRIWPGEVHIKITEKTPIARWNNNSILAAQGEIFQPPEATFPENLPRFVGPEGEQQRMLSYYKKINTLLSSLHFKVSRLEMTPYSSWKMTFDNGIQLAAGHKDILPRLNHFVKLYSKIIGDRASEVEYIDLRYSNGMAVKWKEGNGLGVLAKKPSGEPRMG